MLMRGCRIAAFSLLLGAGAASAGNIGPFTETVLKTNATDPDLVNPWGISFSGTSPFWISDNGTGKATLYNSQGVKQGLVVSMPVGSEDLTGQVFNGASSFNSDLFIFATESGTITGWRGSLGTTAEQLFAVGGAAYKGLAVSTDKSTLFAADFAQGTIDVFSSAGLTGTFSDPTLPVGFAPFNVQNLGGTLFVTFAKVGPTGDDVAGAGNGFVSTFNPTTHTFTRLISQGALNSPWGLALAPAGFDSVGGDLLVGNFGDGLINAFNPTTGALIGTLADLGSNPIVNDGLWAITFGNGGSGGLTNTLYLTAGPNGETGGLFAQINAVPEPSTLLLFGAGGLLLVSRRRKLIRG